jgi:quinol monooxygenase YgiN
MSDTIIVTGTIELDPAKREGAIAAMVECMEKTHVEDGCEGYSFAADLTDPGRFVVSEQWANADALAAHSASEHLAALVGQMGAFGVTKASVTQWSGATPSKIM